MLLAIDVGNTTIMLGTIEDGTIVNIVRIHTEPRYTAAEYGIQLRQLMDYYGIDSSRLDGAIICSVVPTVTEALCQAVFHLTGLNCMVVGPGIKTGMNEVPAAEQGLLKFVDMIREYNKKALADPKHPRATYREPTLLITICANAPMSYKTEKGVYVIPVGCLRD